MAGDHRCEVCGATFTRPQHVGRHMRSHTGDKPYACPHCPDRFARSDLLSRHVNKTHCPPDPNGPGPVQRKKKSKDIAPLNGVGHEGGPSNSRNNYISGAGARPATETSEAARRNSEMSSSVSPSQYQVPASMSQTPAPNVYHTLPNSQNYQSYQPQPMSKGWPVPLAEGDVLEKLAAGTGDLDGEESEDEDVWAPANGPAGVYQASTGYHLNPTIQQMASMRLHQAPSTEMAMFMSQAYTPQIQPQNGMLHSNYQQQPVYHTDAIPATANITTGMVPADLPDIYASSQRNISFGSFYQPFSPGLMAAPPIHTTSDWATGSQAVSHLHSSPVATGSSPVTNGQSPPTWDDRSSGARQSNSPASVVVNSLGHGEAAASTSPALDPAKQSTSPFGEGYSSSMPTVTEDTRLSDIPVFINRPFKKRACEQCNTSKVRCDSQLPCQKCTMRGIRCTYPVGKKLGRKSGSSYPPVAEGRITSEPQPWMYMPPGPAQDALQNYGNVMDRRATIQFGSASSAVPNVIDQVAVDLKLRKSFSAGMGPHNLGLRKAQLRERPTDDDGFSTTSGYTTSLAEEQSRRESMADSIISTEEQMDSDLLPFNNMGIPSATYQSGSWHPGNLHAVDMSGAMPGRPGFPVFQVGGKVTNRAPSLSDVKDAWRQFASGQQPVSIGGLVPPQHIRPNFIHRNRSNSVPDVFPKHFLDLSSDLFANATPKAEVDGFSYGLSTQITASPMTGTISSTAQSASPASVIDTASQGEQPQAVQIARGSSGHSSVSIVDGILPLVQDGSAQGPLNMLDSQDSANRVRPNQQSIARPSIAVFQPTTDTSKVARHILQKGGSQTLAPERPPSFLNASFLDTERNKFKVPGAAGGTAISSQPITSSVKMSSLAARPGNKRLPSQTLGPDYQKKLPIAAETSPLANMMQMASYTPVVNGSRRYSVPNWVGGTVYPGNIPLASMSGDFVDSESSFLQAAFPGTMAVPEFTPTPNNLGGFPFPVPSYT